MSKSHIGFKQSEKVKELVSAAASKPVYIDGVAYRSAPEAAKALGISARTVFRKINPGIYKVDTWNYVSDLWQK